MHLTSDSSSTVESTDFKSTDVQVCAERFSHLRTFEKETGGSAHGRTVIDKTCSARVRADQQQQTMADSTQHCCIAPHTPATDAKNGIQRVPALLLPPLNPSDR